MSIAAPVRAYLIGVAMLVAACTASETFKGTDISGVDWGGDFELTAHTGGRIKSSDFRGKLLVLFFGYTHCPDICAPTLARLAAAMKQLGPEAQPVQVFFVSVDPAHDTPAQLAGFVTGFYPGFIGLTGSAAELAAVARDHRIVAEADPRRPKEFAHSGAVLVKDAHGKLRLLFKNDAPVEDIVHDLRRLLKRM